MKAKTQWSFDWRDRKSGRKRQVTRWLAGGVVASKSAALSEAKMLSLKHGVSVGMEPIDGRPW